MRLNGSLRDNVFKPGEFSAILGVGAGIRARRIPNDFDTPDCSGL
jgi:hypothetical protein